MEHRRNGRSPKDLGGLKLDGGFVTRKPTEEPAWTKTERHWSPVAFKVTISSVIYIYCYYQTFDSHISYVWFSIYNFVAFVYILNAVNIQTHYFKYVAHFYFIKDAALI